MMSKSENITSFDCFIHLSVECSETTLEHTCILCTFLILHIQCEIL